MKVVFSLTQKARSGELDLSRLEVLRNTASSKASEIECIVIPTIVPKTLWRRAMSAFLRHENATRPPCRLRQGDRLGESRRKDDPSPIRSKNEIERLFERDARDERNLMGHLYHKEQKWLIRRRSAGPAPVKKSPASESSCTVPHQKLSSIISATWLPLVPGGCLYRPSFDDGKFKVLRLSIAQHFHRCSGCSSRCQRARVGCRTRHREKSPKLSPALTAPPTSPSSTPMSKAIGTTSRTTTISNRLSETCARRRQGSRQRSSTCEQ